MFFLYALSMEKCYDTGTGTSSVTYSHKKPGKRIYIELIFKYSNLPSIHSWSIILGVMIIFDDNSNIVANRTESLSQCQPHCIQSIVLKRK